MCTSHRPIEGADSAPIGMHSAVTGAEPHRLDVIERDGKTLRRRYMFFYSGQDDASLRAHDQHVCIVVRDLTAIEADLEETGPMHMVRFEDGFTTDVFGDELAEAGGFASW